MIISYGLSCKLISYLSSMMRKLSFSYDFSLRVHLIVWAATDVSQILREELDKPGLLMYFFFSSQILTTNVTCVVSSLIRPTQHLRFFLSFQGSHNQFQTLKFCYETQNQKMPLGKIQLQKVTLFLKDKLFQKSWCVYPKTTQTFCRFILCFYTALKICVSKRITCLCSLLFVKSQGLHSVLIFNLYISIFPTSSQSGVFIFQQQSNKQYSNILYCFPKSKQKLWFIFHIFTSF